MDQEVSILLLQILILSKVVLWNGLVSRAYSEEEYACHAAEVQCPWETVVLFYLWAARIQLKLGLDGQVPIGSIFPRSQAQLSPF